MRSQLSYFVLLLLFVPAFATAQSRQVPLDSLYQLTGSTVTSAGVDTEFGLEIIHADFNGDGVMDIITSSPENRSFDDNPTTYQYSPHVSVYYGESGFDFSNANSTRIEIPATYTDGFKYKEFGLHLSSGDLNNDGIDDILIGFPQYDNQRGRAYVVYGLNNPPQTITLSTMTASDGFYVDGLTQSPDLPDPGSRLGTGFAIGDFDGDGINDLTVNAPFANYAADMFNLFNRPWQGKTYVIYGDAIQGNLTLELDSLGTGQLTTFYVSSQLGATGDRSMFMDLNGDDKEDLVIAAEQSWSQGRIFGIYSSTNRPDSIDLTTFSGNIGTTIYGAFSPTLSEFGKDIASGDFNGDGIEDLVASAPRLRLSTAAITLLFGGPDTFDGFIRSDSPDNVPSLTITGTSDILFSGTFLDLADINGDGFEDLMFSTGIRERSVNTFGAKRFYILAGTDQPLPDTLDLGNPAPEFDLFEITGDSDNTNIGYSVRGADVNDDGIEDLIFGTRSESLTSSNKSSSIHVIPGFEFELTYTDSSDSDTTISGYNFAGGSGTVNDPFQIETVQQLDSVRYFLESHFLQTADLDLSTAGYDTSTGWIPIGYASDDTYLIGERFPFNGSYDGGGFSIRNMRIHNRGAKAGLFYSVAGTIKNLTFFDARITYFPSSEVPPGVTGTEPIMDDIPRFAGIVSAENDGTIENVGIYDSSVEFGSIGLIAGQNTGTITDAHVEGTVSNAAQMGGITGFNLEGLITLSSAVVTLDKSSSLSGGITASNLLGTITESYANSTVTSVPMFGGLIGLFEHGQITNNYADFDIQDSSSVGGLIGYFGISGFLDLDSDPVDVSNNYVFGGRSAPVDDDNFNQPILGFVFAIGADTVALKDSVHSNYWNTSLFGEVSFTGSAFLRLTDGAVTSDEMKQQATFEDWDFGTVWDIDEGSSFPYLRDNIQMPLPGSILNTSNDQHVTIPKEIELLQNYPNPFNPSTNIPFELSSPQIVSLRVFDMLGRQVAELITREQLSAGVHTATFNASGLSSGVYFYTLRAGDQTFTKRLTLIK